MPLNMTDHQIERLIAGKTVNVRVKKKEDEDWCLKSAVDDRIFDILKLNDREKFRVDKDYAVHSKGKAVYELGDKSNRLRARILEITQEEDMKLVYKDEYEYCGEVWCLKCEAVGLK